MWMVNGIGPRMDLSGTPDISSANAELQFSMIEVAYIIKDLLLTYWVHTESLNHLTLSAHLNESEDAFG